MKKWTTMEVDPENKLVVGVAPEDILEPLEEAPMVEVKPEFDEIEPEDVAADVLRYGRPVTGVDAGMWPRSGVDLEVPGKNSLQAGDVFRGEIVLAFLDVRGPSVIPDVLVAVGRWIMRLEDLSSLAGREANDAWRLETASRLGVPSEQRAAFWPVWLARNGVDEHASEERWGARPVCLGWCGAKLAGVVSACACAVPLRSLMVEMGCGRCGREAKPDSAGYHYRHLREEHQVGAMLSTLEVMNAVGAEIRRLECLLRPCPMAGCDRTDNGAGLWSHLTAGCPARLPGDASPGDGATMPGSWIRGEWVMSRKGPLRPLQQLSWRLWHGPVMDGWPLEEVRVNLMSGDDGIWWRRSVGGRVLRGASEVTLEALCNCKGGAKNVRVPVSFWP